MFFVEQSFTCVYPRVSQIDWLKHLHKS